MNGASLSSETVTPRDARTTRATRSLSDLPGPKRLPLIGNVHQMHPERVHLKLEDWWRVYGDRFVVWLGKRPLLVVADGELVRDVLQRRPDVFRRIRAIEDVTLEIGVAGVFSADGDAWRRQRRFINPTFHPRHIEGFFPPIHEITRRLHARWDREAAASEACDVLTDLMRYTVDVTSVVAFGRDLNTLERGPDALQRHLELIFPAINRRVLAPLPYWRYLSLPADRAFNRALSAVQQLIHDLIAHARRKLAGRPEVGARTLLELMIDARDDEDTTARLTDTEIYANVLSILLAGEDTTANTLAWMLYYLGSRPDVQERARAEVDAALGEVVVPSLEHCKRLEYVSAVAQEVLRLRSAAPVLSVEANVDTEVGDIAVPAGTGVIVLTRAVGRKPEYFGDPETFRPERWLAEGAPAVRPHEPKMALAFGGGPRICPGRGLAMLECAVAIGMVLKSFEVHLADHTALVQERLAFAMQPVGLRIRFTRRSGA